MLTEEEQRKLNANKKLFGFDKSEEEQAANRQKEKYFNNKVAAIIRRLSGEQTEDADFEIVEPKQLPDSTQQIK